MKLASTPLPRLMLGLSVIALSACTHTGSMAETPVVAKAPAEAEEPRAKNVILFIGDGMGISTITAARIYAA